MHCLLVLFTCPFCCMDFSHSRHWTEAQTLLIMAQLNWCLPKAGLFEPERLKARQTIIVICRMCYLVKLN